MTPNAVALLAWVWALPQHPFAQRRINTAVAIAVAADETDCPRFWAAILDTWAAEETRYSDDPNISGGCPGVPIGTFCEGRYVGPFMIQRALVTERTLAAEARLAIALFRESARECPAFPFGLFSGVGCKRSALVDGRIDLVMREMAWVQR